MMHESIGLYEISSLSEVQFERRNPRNPQTKTTYDERVT